MAEVFAEADLKCGGISRRRDFLTESRHHFTTMQALLARRGAVLRHNLYQKKNPTASHARWYDI